MFNIGLSEMIFLAVLALIFIGPKELPAVARALGRLLNEFKRGADIFNEELRRGQTDLMSGNRKPRPEQKVAPPALPEPAVAAADVQPVKSDNDPKQL